MNREKATHSADLPHPFEKWAVRPVCRLCKQGEQDQRHLAYEQNREMADDAPPELPRERGA